MSPSDKAPVPNTHRRTSLDISLQISGLILSALKDAARLSPIPFLQESAMLALAIIDVIQAVKSNKDAFLRLGRDTCELVYAILCHSSMTTITPTKLFLDHLQELTRALAEIQRFAKKKISRGTVQRIFEYKSDLDTITEYRERLRQSLDLFGLKASMSIHDNVAQIQHTMEEVLRQSRMQLELNQVMMDEFKNMTNLVDEGQEQADIRIPRLDLGCSEVVAVHMAVPVPNLPKGTDDEVFKRLRKVERGEEVQRLKEVEGLETERLRDMGRVNEIKQPNEKWRQPEAERLQREKGLLQRQTEALTQRQRDLQQEVVQLEEGGGIKRRLDELKRHREGVEQERKPALPTDTEGRLDLSISASLSFRFGWIRSRRVLSSEQL